MAHTIEYTCDWCKRITEVERMNTLKMDRIWFAPKKQVEGEDLMGRSERKLAHMEHMYTSQINVEVCTDCAQRALSAIREISGNSGQES
jgi:hypothetical protein